jgi:8-oxo-dGTP diphosphatase
LPVIWLIIFSQKPQVAGSHLGKKMQFDQSIDSAGVIPFEDILKNSSKNRTSRIGASVNAYLILKQQDAILLHLRKNAGYCDGMWSLVAGHVEDGESATEGMIREAYEEVGISLKPAQIQVVHIMHRKTNRLNVDVFFECKSWQGEIQNREPEKCEKLQFFSLNSFPSNIVDYNAMALRYILEGKFYSELGWKQ